MWSKRRRYVWIEHILRHGELNRTLLEGLVEGIKADLVGNKGQNNEHT